MPAHSIEVPALRIDDGYAAVNFKAPVKLDAQFEVGFSFRPDRIPKPGFVPLLTVDVGSTYLWIAIVDGLAAFGRYPGNAYTGQSFAPLEKTWCHISAVYSDHGQTLLLTAYTRARFLVTPVLRYESQPLPDSVSAGGIQIGGFFSTHLQQESRDANAAFSDLRLWSTARGSHPIQDTVESRLAGNEPGLAGYWMLDEGEGTVFFDSSPNENDGERIVRTYEWERRSGLELRIGKVEGDQKDYLATKQIDHLEAKRAARQRELDAYSLRRSEVEGEVGALETLRQNAEQDVATQTRDSQEKLQAKQKELEGERRAITRAEEEEMKKKSASNTIRLGDFIKHVQEDMKVSRESIRARYGRLYGLDSLSMDVRMIPGFGGVGLHLPDPAKVANAARLSTLTLEFKAKRVEPESKPDNASVPNLEGTTELFARRKLTEAGFKVDSVYQVVDDKSSDNGRVVRQIYTETEKGKAELGSVISLVVGRSR